MPESRLIYDQFKADILQWKNSHREEYNRFARLMTNGDERHYLAICRAIFKQLPKVKTEWELCWGDDSVENFDNISLLFSEESVPEQIVEAFQKQREENNSSDGTSSSFWNKVKSFFRSKSKKTWHYPFRTACTELAVLRKEFRGNGRYGQQTISQS